MVDMSAIAGATASIQAARDLLQSAISARDTALVRERTQELLGHLLEAQQHALSAYTAQTALSDRIRELEAQVTSFEKWDAEKEKYVLDELAPGVPAYRIKEAVRGTAPDHWVCPNCYHDRVASILFDSDPARGRDKAMRCPRCKTDFPM